MVVIYLVPLKTGHKASERIETFFDKKVAIFWAKEYLSMGIGTGDYYIVSLPKSSWTKG